jgi:primosomal protein N' (replication factor Y) (superfamily II helicase)
MFCDVALPVPLDTAFTYRVEGEAPVIGGRVLVPFRERRMPGVVVALHENPPSVPAKVVLRVLDREPLLDDKLLRLARWVAQYYIAPLGEVLRTMLPLNAEWKQVRGYRISPHGVDALYAAATLGSSRRLQSPPEEQASEYEVLDYLAQHAPEAVRETTLRASLGANRHVLQTLVRRKWIVLEDLSGERDARRTLKVAVLKKSDLTPSHDGDTGGAAPTKNRPLNARQQAVLDALATAGGAMPVAELKLLGPVSTLQTLVKRGLVELADEPASFEVSRARVRPALGFTLTSAQQAALTHLNRAVEGRKFSVTLMHGVTGSGKTAVYLAAMQKLLAAGRGAIMLVPEIGLTPAAAAQLHQIFGDAVAILHSGLTDDERAEQWHRIRRGDARIVVGTRSAVFAPVCELALIVVDEEQDHSYKQEETPRYHGRDVAVMRAKLAGMAVVLGSATPSLESYYNAQRGKYQLLEMPERVEQRPLPAVELVDMRQEFLETGHQQVISRKLNAEIAMRLERGEQAMVLLNRRGYSAFVMCRACGETVQCRNCAVAMTYHKRGGAVGSRLSALGNRPSAQTAATLAESQPLAGNSFVASNEGFGRLVCHYCGFHQRVPAVCPKCGSDYVQFLGTGSEKLEELLHAQFPQARIGRLDRDTVRDRGDIERALNAMEAGELDLLVGTQMIAKGHDLHGVTLVGVVAADAALAFPDFRAAERTFQLLTQVAGRAGRGHSPGKVVVQAYFPDHYAVQYAAHHDFNGFYDKELRYRSWMHYPPFTALANVLIRSDRLEEALKYSGLIGNWFRDTRHEGIRVLGPATAPIVRLKGEHRFHLLLKSASRDRLNTTLRAMLAHAAEMKIPRLNLVVDVDAVSLS